MGSLIFASLLLFVGFSCYLADPNTFKYTFKQTYTIVERGAEILKHRNTAVLSAKYDENNLKTLMSVTNNKEIFDFAHTHHSTDIPCEPFYWESLENGQVKNLLVRSQSNDPACEHDLKEFLPYLWQLDLNEINKRSTPRFVTSIMEAVEGGECEVVHYVTFKDNITTVERFLQPSYCILDRDKFTSRDFLQEQSVTYKFGGPRAKWPTLKEIKAKYKFLKANSKDYVMIDVDIQTMGFANPIPVQEHSMRSIELSKTNNAVDRSFDTWTMKNIINENSAAKVSNFFGQYGEILKTKFQSMLAQQLSQALGGQGLGQGFADLGQQLTQGLRGSFQTLKETGDHARDTTVDAAHRTRGQFQDWNRQAGQQVNEYGQQLNQFGQRVGQQANEYGQQLDQYGRQVGQAGQQFGHDVGQFGQQVGQDVRGGFHDLKEASVRTAEHTQDQWRDANQQLRQQYGLNQ